MVLKAQNEVREDDAHERHGENRDEVCDPPLFVVLVDTDSLVRELLDWADHAAQPDALTAIHLEHVTADEPCANADGGVGDDGGDDVENHQKRSGATSATSR